MAEELPNPMIDNRHFLLALVSGLLFASGLLAAIVVSEQGPARADDVPLLVAPSTTITSTTAPPEPPVTATTVAQSQPVDVPANPYAAEPIQEIGVIEIPKIGLRHAVFHGISMRNIDRGPSHWPGTALPGQVGNAVFAGHRVTKTRPFRNIDQLVPGDEVHFTINGIRTTYLVTGHEVVLPTALHIVNPTPTPTATLFACHPPGSARYRYVVRLALAAD